VQSAKCKVQSGKCKSLFYFLLFTFYLRDECNPFIMRDTSSASSKSF